MSYVDKMIKFANRLDKKFEKYAQEVSQTGTTELFFNSEGKQREFASAIQNQSGSCFKALAAWYSKYEQPCSLHISVNAEPGKSAGFSIITNPPSLATSLSKEVDKTFRSVVGSSIAEKLKQANSAASKGAGSGKLDIASIDLD